VAHVGLKGKNSLESMVLTHYEHQWIC